MMQVLVKFLILFHQHHLMQMLLSVVIDSDQVDSGTHCPAV